MVVQHDYPPVDVEKVRRLSSYLPGLGHYYLGKRKEGLLLAGLFLFLASILLASLLWPSTTWVDQVIRALLGLPGLWGLLLTWRLAPEHAAQQALHLHLRSSILARTKDGEIEIGIGKERGVKRGQIFQVRRHGDLLGELRISQVKEETSLGSVRPTHTESPPPKAGDLVAFLR
jgi:hypothetical protein